MATFPVWTIESAPEPPKPALQHHVALNDVTFASLPSTRRFIHATTSWWEQPCSNGCRERMVCRNI